MNSNYTPLISIDDAEYRTRSLGPIRRPRTPAKTSPYPSSSSPKSAVPSSSIPSSSVPLPSVPAPSASIPFAPVASVPTAPMASVPPAPVASVPPASVVSIPPAPVASVPPAPVASVPPAPVASVPPAPVASVPSAPAASVPVGSVMLPPVIHASSSSTPLCQQSSSNPSRQKSPVTTTTYPGLPASNSDQPNDTGMQTRSQKQVPTVRIQSSDKAPTALIPKPDGENRRPGRGGYALKTVLSWDPKEYKKVQDFVRELVNTTLPKNIHTPFTLQPTAVLDPLRKQMVEKFLRLRQYEDNWATDDFIRAALKSRQIQLKNRKLRVQAVQGQAVLDMQQNL
ncbi:hypothetical protein VKT23_019322 [Stygiomarasmius scandens]|uniref:Uncharacterized protein n=1 Tax=Marasmiellus scandens TaxID=2682957 RepID=A0ABR1ILR4_9AGAR